MLSTEAVSPGFYSIDGVSNGTYSLAWENTTDTANVETEISILEGEVELIINDARGKEILNKKINETTLNAEYLAYGKAGMWLITIYFNDFDGEGYYVISPN